MADKKKMSVADILAAARKADSGGAPADESAQPATPSAAPTDSSGAAPEAPAPSSPPKPVAKPGAAGRPSVADMLAMARAGKGADPAAAATAAKAPTESPKPAAEKPAAAKSKPVAAAPAPSRDTASILAAARKTDKPGPMTKAEAAARGDAPAAVAAKPKVIVPPMPVKPAYAKLMPAAVAPASDFEEGRRSFLGLGFWLLGAVSTLWTLLTVKFMFPNVLREPPSKFKVGNPDAFPAGQVQEKFKAQFAVWIVNTEYNGKPEIFALKSVCTHLGCTPNWLEAEQKFKCPCHGSGFYKDGINFEGPAPRPLERYAIRLADDGQIEVDKSRTFQEEMGQWNDPASFIPV